MNYLKIYNLLINKANMSNRLKNSDVYYENHHIKPKCIGGNNSKQNLVLLTAREHFLAHWLLTKIYINNSKIIYAFNSFCMNTSGGDRTTSHLYKYARNKYTEMLKTNTEWKQKLSKVNKNKVWIYKDNTSKKIDDFNLQLYLEDGWKQGRITFQRRPHSKETRDKMSKSHATKYPEERVIKMREISKDKIWIHKDNIEKMLREPELSKYLTDGWIKGRANSIKEKVKDSKINKIPINKNGKIKWIFENELVEYTHDEWIKGTGKIPSNNFINSNKARGTIWINKNGSIKRIPKELLQQYLKDNWKKGRK